MKLRVPLAERYDRLTVLGFEGARTKQGQAMVTCVCDCGTRVNVMPSSLRRGLTTSCGCRRREVAIANGWTVTTHGESSGGRVSDLYRAWAHIKGRCHSPTHESYPDYGGRGIALWPAWHDFEAFRRDIDAAIGRRPTARHSFDRIDNDRGYEPGNLRWATKTEQVRNRRVTRFYELDGERRSLPEWCELAGVPYDMVLQRLDKHRWSLDEALGTPARSGGGAHDVRRLWSEREKGPS